MYLGGSVLIARNSYRILNLIGPHIRFAALFIIMLSVGMSQTRQDLELLKSLANQQRQEIITEAETVKIPEEVGPTMTEVDLPEPDPKLSLWVLILYSIKIHCPLK